ncbi:uncharacterized protein LOC115886492 [Sitophilus oryzae]|uniref:Uncharacterized protein LOC115886492 n=1 Tax=Sitophilus oryzae TaxID=7048 RepID=A0A6J2YDT4_SITOR|nr:uncharacterized protein LOC115886492 [Sitophilus oryzae]
MNEPETQLRSSNLTDDSTPEQPPPTEKHSSLLKVRKKGDRIYQLDDENLTVLKDPQFHSASESSEVDLDKVSSGESLYKTISFENSLTKEETEKCVQFWRSVIERNLEPIKCSVIERINEKTAETKIEKDKKTTRKKNKKKESENELGKLVAKKSVWWDILEELQKKKLHETKLMIEKRCRFCHYISGEYEQDPAVMDSEKQIKDLDNWTPTVPAESRSERKSRGSLKSGSSRSSRASRASRKPSRKASRKSDMIPNLKQQQPRKSSSFKVKDEPPEKIPEEPTDLEDLILLSKEDAKSIEFVNVVEQKKEDGVYSMWRTNQIPPCECDKEKCDCNENPAIVEMTNSMLEIKVLERVADASQVLPILAPEIEKEKSIKSTEEITAKPEASSVIPGEKIESSSVMPEEKRLIMDENCHCDPKNCRCCYQEY